MLDSIALYEFADKYSDHIVFASATGSGTLLSEVWRLLPVEIAVMLMAAFFILARIAIEHALRLWHARHHHKHSVSAPTAPRKHRTHA